MRRANQARWYPADGGAQATVAAGVDFLARPVGHTWQLLVWNEQIGTMDDIGRPFSSFVEIKDYVDLYAPKYARFNREARLRAGRVANEETSGDDVGYRIRDQLMEEAESCGEHGDAQCMESVLRRARKELARDPDLLFDVENVATSYFPELVKGPKRRRSKKAGKKSREKNQLGTLAELPKGARMWEAVFEAAKERGYPDDRAAEQAWGAVEQAGYWKDPKGTWQPPSEQNPTPPEKPMSKRRTKNAEPGDPDYHRRNIVIDKDLALRALDWHGGQGSMLYSFGSTVLAGDYVSPSMIDAAVSELEGSLGWAKKNDPKLASELEDLIGELDARARFSSEFTTKEFGLGDVDSGTATWLMETEENPRGNMAPQEISGPLRIERRPDGLWVVGHGLAIPVESRTEADRVLGQLSRRRNPPDVTAVRFDTIDGMADGLDAMDRGLRPTRHERPVVFRLDWEDKTILLEGHPDERSITAALDILDRAQIPFDADVLPYAANPEGGTPGRAAGYAFLGQWLGSILGFGLGALIGAGAGALVGGGPGALTGGAVGGGVGSYAGGIWGGASGGRRGAPKGREDEAALGGGLASAVPFLGWMLAPLGAYIGAEKPARASNKGRSSRI